MTPLALMRVAGWTFLAAGLVFLGLAVLALLTNLDGPPWSWLVLALMGIAEIVVGVRYIVRTPSAAELARWTSRKR